MKYNLTKTQEAIEAQAYLKTLLDKKCLVEIKRISPRRSLNQNNYLHLLLGAYGLEVGLSVSEAKSDYKRANADLYLYKKNGHVYWRSSADLTKEQMAKSIDHFIQDCAAIGIQLPLATDQEWLRQIENEIERAKYYM